MRPVSPDWGRWHESYDDPDSSLSRRRIVVRDQLAALLGGIPQGRPARVASMCSGDGGNELTVFAAHPGQVEAVLVESDPDLAARALATAKAMGLHGVQVVVGDAGESTPYASVAPADVVLAVGVFGNVSVESVERTVAVLPSLLTDGGAVIWSRGAGNELPDPSEAVRGVFARRGFDEIAFVRPRDATFRIGVHRLEHGVPFAPGHRLFTFAR